MVDACFDKPNPMDFKSEDLMGAFADKTKTFPKDLLNVPNQGIDPKTTMSCTRQGLANITNGNNLISQWTQDSLLAKRKWLEAVDRSPWISATGDYLQNALNQFKEDKLIAGYYIVSGKDAHMSAIDKGHFIYSGSNNGDWGNVRDKWIYAIKNPSSGHAYVKGVEYNDKGLIGLNSYGIDNGFFLLPWELCDTTFTSYAIIDFDDEEAILLYKKQLMEKEIQEATDFGIFNGKDLDSPVTRSECARMVLRAYKLTQK